MSDNKYSTGDRVLLRSRNIRLAGTVIEVSEPSGVGDLVLSQRVRVAWDDGDTSDWMVESNVLPAYGDA